MNDNTHTQPYTVLLLLLTPMRPGGAAAAQLTNCGPWKLLTNWWYAARLIAGHKPTGCRITELLHGFRVHRYAGSHVARPLRPFVALLGRRTDGLKT